MTFFDACFVIAVLCAIGIPFTSYMDRRERRRRQRSRLLTFHVRTFNAPRTYARKY